MSQYFCTLGAIVSAWNTPSRGSGSATENLAISHTVYSIALPLKGHCNHLACHDVLPPSLATFLQEEVISQKVESDIIDNE